MEKTMGVIGVALGIFLVGLTIFNVVVYGITSTASFEF
jgi:hypothetical protein